MLSGLYAPIGTNRHLQITIKVGKNLACRYINDKITVTLFYFVQKCCSKSWPALAIYCQLADNASDIVMLEMQVYMSMNFLWVVVATIAVFILLILLLGPLFNVNLLLKLELWAPRKTACQRSNSGELLVLLDLARQELEQAGFRYMHSWSQRSMQASADFPASYCDVYHHLAQDVHAEVYPGKIADSKRLYNICLWNTYIDGRALLTMNGQPQSAIPYPSRVTVIADKSSDFAGQMATHLHVREMISIQRTDPVEAPEIAQNLAERWLVRLEREGKVRQLEQRDGETIYGLRFWPTLQLVTKTWLARWRHIGKKTKPSSVVNSNEASLQAARQVHDRHAFVSGLFDLRAMTLASWKPQVLQFVSSSLFVGFAASIWGVPGALLMLAAVIWHDLAQRLAYHFSGLQHLPVLFSGTAVTPLRADSKPVRQVLVYLAGPVAGMLLALSIIAVLSLQPGLRSMDFSPYLYMLVIATLFLSGLNLLPLFLFDGGRLLDALLLARLPRWRIIFTLSCAIPALVYGWLTDNQIVLLLGACLLLGAAYLAPLSYAAVRLLRQDGKSLPASVSLYQAKNFAGAAASLYDFYSQAAFAKWRVARKLLSSQNLLPRYLMRMPSRSEAAIGIILYLACIAICMAALFAAARLAPDTVMKLARQSMSTRVLAAESEATLTTPAASKDSKANAANAAEQTEATATLRQQRAAAINASQGNARTAALKAALHDAGEENDAEDVLRIAKIYYAENNNSVQATYEHADAAFTLSGAMRHWSADEDSEGEKRNQAEVANYLQEAEAILRTRLHLYQDRKDARLLLIVLEVRDLDADSPAELTLKQEMLNLFARNKEEDMNMLQRAHSLLASSYFRLGNADEAGQELQNAQTDADCASKPLENYFCQMMNLDRAWILLSKKKFEEADKLVTPYLDAKLPRHLRVTTLTREGHQLKWMSAQLQKDTLAAHKEAMALLHMQTPLTGNWLLDYLAQQTRPAGDYSSNLLLADSLRGIGEQSQADSVVEQVLAEQRKTSKDKGDGKALTCKTSLRGKPWNHPFRQSLLQIEQRETKCQPRVNSNW